MQEIARRIVKVSKESKLAIEEEDYVSSFKVELMDAVVQWCRGASFSEICKVSFPPMIFFFGFDQLILPSLPPRSSLTNSREV